MQIEYNSQVYECCLLDDGSLDTVISIDGKEIRLDSEYASQYRDEDGTMTEKGFIKLCWEEIEVMDSYAE